MEEEKTHVTPRSELFVQVNLQERAIGMGRTGFASTR